MVISGCPSVLAHPGPVAVGWAAPSGVGGFTGTVAWALVYRGQVEVAAPKANNPYRTRIAVRLLWKFVLWPNYFKLCPLHEPSC